MAIYQFIVKWFLEKYYYKFIKLRNFVKFDQIFEYFNDAPNSIAYDLPLKLLLTLKTEWTIEFEINL